MRRKRWIWAVALFATSCGAPPTDGSVAKRVGQVTLEGPVYQGDEISDAVVRGRWMALVAAEGNRVQILKKKREDAYEASDARTLALAKKTKTEFDLEAVAWGTEYVYAIGSHAKRRERVRAQDSKRKLAKSVRENRQRLENVLDGDKRRNLCRFRVDEEGRPVAGSLACISLYDVLKELKPIGRFRRIPGKENGIDIEGLAVEGDDRLYIGFRGPVLRGNFVPVLVFDISNGFKATKDRFQTRYLDLGGRGVRELHRMPSGRFLVLGGPVGDGPGSVELYLWNGRDCVPGHDKPSARQNVRALCTVPPPDDTPGASAEGVCALAEQDATLRFLVTYDGADNGAPTVFECALPR